MSVCGRQGKLLPPGSGLARITSIFAPTQHQGLRPVCVHQLFCGTASEYIVGGSALSGSGGYGGGA
jgi:hypothetical protein